MKIDTTSKILLALIVILLAVGAFGYRSIKKDLSIEQDERQKLIEDVEKSKKHLIDSLQKESSLERKKMQVDINNLSKYSRALVKKLKQYEENPNYNIDYLTAVRIITDSNYKRRRDSIRQKKDNRRSENN